MPLLKDPESAEPLPDIALLDTKIAEAEAAISEAASGPLERKAKERKEDLMRLKRVEMIYVRTLYFGDYCLLSQQSDLRYPRVVRLGVGATKTSTGDGVSWHRPTTGSPVINVFGVPTWGYFS